MFDIETLHLGICHAESIVRVHNYIPNIPLALKRLPVNEHTSSFFLGEKKRRLWAISLNDLHVTLLKTMFPKLQKNKHGTLHWK